jgi:uncharacterized protein YciI
MRARQISKQNILFDFFCCFYYSVLLLLVKRLSVLFSHTATTEIMNTVQRSFWRHIRLMSTSARASVGWQVSCQSAVDYLARRGPFRKPHIDRVTALRTRGQFVSGGPSTDGKTADLFFRGDTESEIRALIEADPYWTGRVWEAFTIRQLPLFLPPTDPEVPVILDGSRVLALVEGTSNATAFMQHSGPAAQKRGVFCFGGVDARGGIIVASSDEKAALDWLSAESGVARSQLRSRPWIRVL